MKNLVPLAIVAVAGPALAQSHVTLYGRIDLGLAQHADAAGTTDDEEVRQESGSRLGFRGAEDLGGGLSAFFDIQHRFDADTGDVTTSRFWEGQSVVGIAHTSWGRVSLGRTESASYALVELPADPFANDTVAQGTQIVRGRIGTNRNSSTVNYRGTFGGLTVQAQIAESEENPSTAAITGVDPVTGLYTTVGGTIDDRPHSVAASYTAGPLQIAAGYENPPDADDHWAVASASYNIGVAKVGLFFGDGKNVLAEKMRGYLLWATAPIGAGELRASYGELENDTRGLKTDKQFGVGYHYALSKRTTLYGDYVRQDRDGIGNATGSAELQKNGYDVGIKHNF
jgi:predicted porin